MAVVAPESEVEDALRRGSTKLFLLLGIVILAVALGAGAIIWLENRWSKVLETRVLSKTEALVKSEEKYRSLVESAEDFIFTVDREGRFQSLNTFTANFFGGPPEIFIGKPISNAFPAPQADRLTALIARVQESLAPTTFWVGLIKAPVFAFLIAYIGTLRGLQVRGSSRELGRLTTVAVVQSIFLVILVDALFAILFLEIDF